MHQTYGRRSLFIQTELTPNVNSIKFKPGKPLMSSSTTSENQSEGGKDDLNASTTHEFLSRREAMKSPLATTLFAVEGVESVMFGYDFITVTKTLDSNWQLMKPGEFLFLLINLMHYCWIAFAFSVLAVS